MYQEQQVADMEVFVPAETYYTLGTVMCKTDFLRDR